jgi:hypothetical protein
MGGGWTAVSRAAGPPLAAADECRSLATRYADAMLELGGRGSRVRGRFHPGPDGGLIADVHATGPSQRDSSFAPIPGGGAVWASATSYVHYGADHAVRARAASTGGRPSAVAIAPDGRLAAIATLEGTLTWWPLAAPGDRAPAPPRSERREPSATPG